MQFPRSMSPPSLRRVLLTRLVRTCQAGKGHWVTGVLDFLLLQVNHLSVVRACILALMTLPLSGFLGPAVFHPELPTLCLALNWNSL